MVKVLVTKTRSDHNIVKCPNRILVRDEADIDRLMEFIFRDDEAWTEMTSKPDCSPLGREA